MWGNLRVSRVCTRINVLIRIFSRLSRGMCNVTLLFARPFVGRAVRITARVNLRVRACVCVCLYECVSLKRESRFQSRCSVSRRSLVVKFDRQEYLGATLLDIECSLMEHMRRHTISLITARENVFLAAIIGTRLYRSYLFSFVPGIFLLTSRRK